VEGELSDHYDASRKVLRLSRRIHDGRSLTAVGVSAHEVGHALQDASRNRWLFVRNAVVPLANIGSQLFWLLILAGVLLNIDRFILAGLFLFAAILILQLVNLPLEFDASRRGRLALTATEVVESEEQPIVAEVLNAAGWTYVASTFTGVAGLFAGARKV